jgi:fermentation-respiration switch protein FrsA (DUF1100 family)
MFKPVFPFIAVLFLGVVSCESLFNAFAFHPNKKYILSQKELPANCIELSLKTADAVQIQALYFKHPNKKSTLTMYFHGNAGNLYHRIEESQQLFAAGCDVLLLGYRGFGRSEGSVNEAGIYLDGQCLYDYALTTLGYNPNNIILYGRSLGTTVAVHTAQNKNIKGLILITPLSTAEDFARSKNMGSFTSIAKNKFNSVDKLKNITCPILIIHGTHDEVIPYALGKKLYDAYEGKKSFVAIQNGHHNDLEYINTELYWKSVSDFILQ